VVVEWPPTHKGGENGNAEGGYGDQELPCSARSRHRAVVLMRSPIVSREDSMAEEEIRKLQATLTYLNRKAEARDNAVEELFRDVSETEKRREELDAKAARVERRLAEAS